MLVLDLDTISLVMEHSPSLIFVKDQDCRVVFANKAFLEIYPPQERLTIIGRTTVENFSSSEAETFLAEDRRALREGSSELVEEIVSFTGERRVFQTRKIGFTTPSGERRLLGMCNDITELANREASLVQLNAQLQAFSELAAHDLRSPLASFVNALDFIKHDAESSLSKQSLHFISLITESASNLSSNITALLIAAKANNTQFNLDIRECDLNIMLAEVKLNLADLIGRHSVHIYANRLPHVSVEPNLFRQVFQNLIENSIKYRSKGSPKIFIRHHERDERHWFSVEDNGVGVGADATMRAFELYEQEAIDGVQGVGIGLALCKRVMTLHGGHISIDSSFAEGCRVNFDIPVKRQKSTTTRGYNCKVAARPPN